MASPRIVVRMTMSWMLITKAQLRFLCASRHVGPLMDFGITFTGRSSRATFNIPFTTRKSQAHGFVSSLLLDIVNNFAIHRISS